MYPGNIINSFYGLSSPCWLMAFSLDYCVGLCALALFQRDCGKSLEASDSVFSLCSAPAKPLSVQDKPNNLI